jgi:hypothetical protein
MSEYREYGGGFALIESFCVLSKLGAEFITVSTNYETQLESWIQKIRAYE